MAQSMIGSSPIPSPNAGWANFCKQARVQGLAFTTLVLFLALSFFFPQVSHAADDDNCLMCHNLAGLGVFEKDEEGNAVKRIFYVNEKLFKASYHGRVACTGCHDGVKDIPHTNVKKVDCAASCHMTDPSTNSAFSHQRMAQDLLRSAHGKEGAKNDENLPLCKDCHTNKPYQITVRESLQTMNFLKVCVECHESEEWAERFYEHTFYRASIRRSSKEIVALCSRCHADKAMMEKHELDVVVGFEDTFHGKAIIYGDEDVANCLNCHAPYALDYSPHRIGSEKTADSAVHPDNKLATCQQAGCHADAKEKFASQGRVHPPTYTPSKAGQEGTGTSNDEREFQQWVIYLITLVYKILIAVIVGFFVLHRILDILAMRREKRRTQEA